MHPIMVDDGLTLRSGHLSPADQQALVDDLRDVVRAAPFYRPSMPRSGRPFSIQMTNAGPLGWVSDRTGYRYQAHHPETTRPWPTIPVLSSWTEPSSARARSWGLGV